MKQCTKCQSIKPTTQFGNKSWINADGSKTSVKKSHCRQCVNEENLKRYHNNTSTRDAHSRAAHKHRVKSYGLTVEDYQQMWDSCGGVCEICGSASERRLCVDHNHITGKVRGLLCSKCNSAIGFVKEDLSLVEKLIDYLKVHNENDSS